VGALIAEFMDEVVGRAAMVSGHSSGGLIALWLASARPDLVSALLLEDPPLFSSIPPRLAKTVGGVLPRLAAEYLRGGSGEDFQRLYVARSRYFEFFGPFEPWIQRYALRWLDRHPGLPLRIAFLPSLVNVFFEGLVEYDPSFGAAWDDGTWYSGFDTDAALRAVTAPATLVHTTWWHQRHGTSYSDAGVLMAAMDADDATRAADLLATPSVVTLPSGHLVHYERPKEYLGAIADLSKRARRRR
jgi:pimeloyl-ACP methyl ester carboxylesterase